MAAYLHLQEILDYLESAFDMPRVGSGGADLFAAAAMLAQGENGMQQLRLLLPSTVHDPSWLLCLSSLLHAGTFLVVCFSEGFLAQRRSTLMTTAMRPLNMWEEKSFCS